MKKVICSGTTNKDFFKCEEKKCEHRILHEPVKGRCNCRNFNGRDGWCVAPGTTSLIDGHEDGGLVSCMTSETLVKEEKISLKHYLSSATKEMNDALIDIETAKKRYNNACKLVKDIKERLNK